MRIGFFLQDTGAVYGAERATLDLVTGLRSAKQIDVSVILIRECGRNTARQSIAREFERLGISVTILNSHHRFSWSLVARLRRHVIEHGIDCLHVVGYKAAIHGGAAMKFGAVRPWISTVHGWLYRPDIKERFYKWLEIQFLKRANRVICLSQYYQALLIRQGLLDQQLRLIPSGLDIQSMHVDASSEPFANSSKPPTIGVLGRLSYEKNHALVLRVARKLADSGLDVRFLIAGDGPEQSQICRLQRELGLEGVVTLPGRVERDTFFQEIDLLLSCSKIENLPYVILEAMAWSRPVVATRVGGVPDLIESNETGLLADCEENALCCAIQGLLKNPNEARKMGKAGRQRLDRLFTLSRCVEAHTRLYYEVTRSPFLARP